MAINAPPLLPAGQAAAIKEYAADWYQGHTVGMEMIRAVNPALFEQMPKVLVNFIGTMYGEGGWPVTRLGRYRWIWETEALHCEMWAATDTEGLFKAWIRNDDGHYPAGAACFAVRVTTKA